MSNFDLPTNKEKPTTFDLPVNDDKKAVQDVAEKAKVKRNDKVTITTENAHEHWKEELDDEKKFADLAAYATEQDYAIISAYAKQEDRSIRWLVKNVAIKHLVKYAKKRLEEEE